MDVQNFLFPWFLTIFFFFCSFSLTCMGPYSGNLKRHFSPLFIFSQMFTEVPRGDSHKSKSIVMDFLNFDFSVLMFFVFNISNRKEWPTFSDALHEYRTVGYYQESLVLPFVKVINKVQERIFKINLSPGPCKCKEFPLQELEDKQMTE